MRRLFVLILLLCFAGCRHQQRDNPESAGTGTCACVSAVDGDSSNFTLEPSYKTIRGALLGTRFKSLEELKSVIQIEYFNHNAATDSVIHAGSWVRVRHCSNGTEVISVLKAGTSQGDIYKARYNDSIRYSIKLVFNCPYAVSNRKDLEKIFTLSRWRPERFGEGDLAFYDIAKATAGNINTKDLAFLNARDSTEKGYLNSINHITAQAFITSCFSEEMADFIADAHERYHHPELILGKFSEVQLTDLDEGPVDNYVDIINNEWGQDLGKQLKEKYHITPKTDWTPALLANYLNDMQSYYSWAFQIGFKPFRPEDETVRRFADKINVVMKGRLGKTS